MLGDESLILLRSKEFKIRLLDKDRISKEKQKWQIANSVLPLVFVIFLGLVFFILKRQLYAKRS